MITKNPFEKRSYFINGNSVVYKEILAWLNECGINFNSAYGQIWFKNDDDELMFVMRWL